MFRARILMLLPVFVCLRVFASDCPSLFSERVVKAKEQLAQGFAGDSARYPGTWDQHVREFMRSSGLEREPAEQIVESLLAEAGKAPQTAREAAQVMNLPESATQDQVKKQFKTLAQPLVHLANQGRYGPLSRLNQANSLLKSHFEKKFGAGSSEGTPQAVDVRITGEYRTIYERFPRTSAGGERHDAEIAQILEDLLRMENGVLTHKKLKAVQDMMWAAHKELTFEQMYGVYRLIMAFLNLHSVAENAEYPIGYGVLTDYQVFKGWVLNGKVTISGKTYFRNDDPLDSLNQYP